jgi:hypothetical protein
MKRATQRPITETRQAHTIYLTAEVWDALERAHLQARLADADSRSKIEFIEEILKLGMQALAGQNGVSPTSDEVPTAQSQIPTRRGPDPADTPNASPEASQPRTRRRSSPVERLLQASDPGRPAPIRSVATQKDLGDDHRDGHARLDGQALTAGVVAGVSEQSE